MPYDFGRKRLNVLVECNEKVLLVTKGALQRVRDACSTARRIDGTSCPIEEVSAALEQRFIELSAQGYRTLGVAIKEITTPAPMDRESELDMTLLGILALADPLKQTIEQTIVALNKLGVRLKMITGDNAQVTARIGAQVSLSNTNVLTGTKLRTLSEAASMMRVQETDIFAEIEPNQKEAIIRALRKTGHVVGYMGDGINDAPALHAADVLISVQGAVDVAKEAADIVLLERDLAVLEAGVRKGGRHLATRSSMFLWP